MNYLLNLLVLSYHSSRLHQTWHEVLTHESSLLTAFNCHLGKFIFTRMPFGVNALGDVFQYKLDHSIGELQNVYCIQIILWSLVMRRTIQIMTNHSKTCLSMQKNATLSSTLTSSNLRKRRLHSLVRHTQQMAVNQTLAEWKLSSPSSSQTIRKNYSPLELQYGKVYSRASMPH